MVDFPSLNLALIRLILKRTSRMYALWYGYIHKRYVNMHAVASHGLCFGAS